VDAIGDLTRVFIGHRRLLEGFDTSTRPKKLPEDVDTSSLPTYMNYIIIG
jgi:hypothetical protein